MLRSTDYKQESGSGLILKVLLIGLTVGGPGTSRSTFAQEPGQKTYKSPAAAAAALAAAAQEHDKQQMLAILGPAVRN
jgi:hypothetical protein